MATQAPTHALRANGTSLSYREQGSGPPVLLIHGSGTYSETFEPLLERLPADVRTIVYDRRGFAASGGPLARGLDVHVKDAAALLESLGAAPATVVGSSMGGVLALRLAVQRPDLVSALVLIEPAYQLALIPSPGTSLAIGRVMARWALRRDADGAALGFYRWATARTSGGNQFDDSPERWQRTALGHPRATLRELLVGVPPLPTRAALRRIEAPTSVIIGDAGVLSFRRAARRALKAIPGAVEIPAPGAAHLVYLDAPGICADAIVAAARGGSGA